MPTKPQIATPRYSFVIPVYNEEAMLPILVDHLEGFLPKLDDTLRLAEKAQKAGVSVQLRVWQGAVHAWQNQPHLLPEARQAIQEIITFIKTI